MASPAMHPAAEFPVTTEFTIRVKEQSTPSLVLDALHDLVSRRFPLSVLGAWRFRIKASEWRSAELGRDVFLHSSAPEGWWSMGRRTEEIPKALELGEETVRSHLKKLQTKLGVRNRAQATAEAVSSS